jgi:hypothetical protein
MAPNESIHRIRSVRLVSPDDAAYVAAMAEQALAHRRYGPKGEQSATYRVSGRVESAVRGWLAARVPLLAERIIAAEVLYRDARRYEPLYLELDAVQGSPGTPGTPVRIFEIKFTSNSAAVARGLGQLSRALRLLRAQFEDVDGLAVVVHGSREGFRADDPRLAEVALMGPDALAIRPLPPRAVLQLDLADLAAALSEEDRRLLEVARDEGDASVAARRERAAQASDPDGGARDDVPPGPSQERKPGVTLAFGGEPDDDASADSPFAALRGLVVPDER